MSKSVLNSSIGVYGTKATKNNNKPLQIGVFVLAYTCIYHLKLKQLMTKAKVPRVLYGDTDSVCLDKHVMERLIALEPGMMYEKGQGLSNAFELSGELEGEGSPGIIVLGKKMYHCHTKSGSKGIPRNNITYEFFQSVLKQEQITTRWTPDKYANHENNVCIGKFKQAYRNKKSQTPKTFILFT